MSGCSYDCSQHPTSVDTDNDITGIGVIIGYVATAGIVVFVIVAYYLLAFQPRLDPFRHNSLHPRLATRARPNPVDEILLRDLRRGFHKVIRTNPAGLEVQDWVEKGLIKCILSMSDIQIITGVSILVSGAAQLQCGLPTYQWQILVYLAWFSSLTHLSSLTILRNYLYNRPAERGWRLFSMLLLVILLIFAFLPTGNYRWMFGYGWMNTGLPKMEDAAICYLKPVSLPNPVSPLSNYGPSFTEQAMISMSISILLLAVGFLMRLFKLHKSISHYVDESIRGQLSHLLRTALRKYHDLFDFRNSPRSLQRTLFYRPVLALFLTARIGLDLWSSMFFEVWWLCVSFIWGVERLLYTLNLYPDKENSQWTFGQVMSVALLAIPLVTMVELFYPGSKGHKQDGSDDDSTPETELEDFSNPLPAPVGHHAAHRASIYRHEVVDHPDWELYYTSGSLTLPVWTAVGSIITVCIFFMVDAATGIASTGILSISFSPWGQVPLLVIFSTSMSVLFSFVISRIGSGSTAYQHGKKWIARGFQFIVFFYLAVLPLVGWPYLFKFDYLAICVAIGVYLFCAIIYLISG
ncbi:uncharacterized protein N7459_000055 [Penicillium hispanicum]|uniref:uncharacterized protein n=1 Tax=Penicillium hispanicum TaxID=1080232 RepID=UPI00253FE223|nr:uncharacterized protein N7459_000055 [Penicillium hispanicum]KAJ5593847.1 hypothetical protein N7459_000055 [Penicillium hispanicum]